MNANRTLALLLAGGLFLAGSAYAAEPEFTVADENVAIESYFELEFPEPFGTSYGAITDTDMVMRYVFEAAEESARFLDYDQDVESITLPGGIETGAIQVLIVDSQPVDFTFDARSGAGVFETIDVYAIYFENDLSAFGIESPFILESTSTGTIQFDGENNGWIDMIWEGAGVIGEEPNELPFIYRCEVHTLFSIPGDGDFNADGLVNYEDQLFWAGCFSGNGNPYDLPVCEMTDFDADGDVDRHDAYVIFKNWD